MFLNLIKLNFKLILSVKMILSTLAILLICALAQTVAIKYFNPHYLGDFLLYSIGGVIKNEMLIRLLLWIILILPLMYFLSKLFGSNKYDYWILTRSVSRLNWFLSKWIVLIIIVIGYGILIIVVHSIVGVFFYSPELIIGGSVFSTNKNPLELFLLNIVIFFTGLVALSTLVTLVSFLWNHTSIIYLIMTILIVIPFLISNVRNVPTILSPLNYMVYLNLGNNGHGILLPTLRNIFVILISFLFSLLISRKRLN